MLRYWSWILLLLNAGPFSGSIGQAGDAITPVPGGIFTMGSRQGDADEQPARTVTLSPFYIQAYEVTEARYNECVAAGLCTPAHYDDTVCRVWNGKRFAGTRIAAQARNPDNPVVCVTWYQARQYCNAYRMSLPSETQWEYAAHAGTSTRYPWGDQETVAHRCVISRSDGPQRVGSCPPNGWRLYDMIGNVWEWVDDRYDPAAYNSGTASDPVGPQAGFYRVIRGGGWYSGSGQATVTNRQWYSPDFAEASIGFRCVKR